MKEYVLLVECPDKVGLINKITSVLALAEFNIISNREFVDPDSKTFFMRTHVVGPEKSSSVLYQLNQLNLNPSTLIFKEKSEPQVVIFASDEYHCLSDLLTKNQQKDLGAQVLAVISQKDSLKNLSLQFNVPFIEIKNKGLTRENHESEILKVLNPLNPDYLIAAKYMRIFTEKFTSKFENKIINIHHSFLPSFKGYNPYEEAFSRGVKIIGATAHFVNKDLDEGPIISQKVLPVNQNWSISDMKKQGRSAEVNALSEALDLVFADRVLVFKNKTIIL